MANYNSSYTGAQIDEAVGKALNPDTTPTTGSSSLVTSGGAAAALADKQAKITASGVLQGDGNGGVSAKTLDTSSLTNDNDHIPTSGVVKSALGFVPDTGNAGWHNSIYRGESLGSSVTAAQWAAISAGTFDDMFIGDYWTIPVTIGGTSRDVRWRIAAFDYWRGVGSGTSTADVTMRTEHHVVIVPDQVLATGKINSTATSAGGYIGSDYYTGNNSNSAKTNMTSYIETAFGSNHLKSSIRYFSNAITDGQASGQAEVTATVELMNEIMLMGHQSVSQIEFYEVGSDKTILPLFLLNPEHIMARAIDDSGKYAVWLRSIASDTTWGYVVATGRIGTVSASATAGFRPAFAIKG